MSKQKQKGTAFEKECVDYLELNKIQCRRQAPAGARDMGDIEVFIDHRRGVLECKSHKTVTRGLVLKWMEETRQEVKNAEAMYGVLVIKRPRHGIEEAWCILSDYSQALLLLPVVESSPFVVEFKTLLALTSRALA